VQGSVTVHGDLPVTPAVRVRTNRVNRLLGTAIATDEIVSLLTPIGFVCEEAGEADVLSVTVPTFRPDTTTETDVIEEIARHFGYSRIVGRAPTSAHTGSLTPIQRDRRIIRQILVGLGIHEAMPLPFLAPGDLARCGLPPEAVTVTNPLAAEESILRTSLRPGLLRAIAYNESHRTDSAALFEIGKAFGVPSAGTTLPDEREHLAVALAGADAFAVARIWAVLAETLGLDDIAIDQSAPPAGLHPGRSGVLLSGGVPVGEIGEIDPGVLDALGIRERVAWLQLDLGASLATPHGEHRYRHISRYPSSDLDLAFEVGDSVAAATIAAAIREAAGPLLVDLSLFDVFRGNPVPDSHRSLAYRLRLQATDRTLTEEDLSGIQRTVVDAAASVGAVLRG
jgi:phenylalanyl-tRNA synthetase beta chain